MNSQYFKVSKNIFNVNNTILDEYEKIINLDEFKVHDNISILQNKNQINKFINLKNLLSNITEFIEDTGKKLIFDDIWVVKSNFGNTNNNTVPYVPHIDNIRKYKIMIYMNDVDINSGPLHLTDVNPDIFENKRKSFSKNYKEKGENVISNYNLNEYEACIGNFGTTIFFDTNTPHFAGRVHDKKKIRKILRFNFRYVDSMTKNINTFLKALKITNKNYFFYKN